MNDGVRVAEGGAGGPAAVFDAEDVEREGISAHGDNPVFADDAVLLAAADEFTGEEEKRPLAAVDENELIDGGAGGIRGANDAVAAIAVAGHAFGSLFADDDLAGGEAFIESEESGRIAFGRTDDRENREVSVGDGVEKAPVAGRFAGRWGGGIGAEDEAEGAEPGQAEQSGEQRSEQVAIHESLLVQGWCRGEPLHG